MVRIIYKHRLALKEMVDWLRKRWSMLAAGINSYGIIKQKQVDVTHLLKLLDKHQIIKYIELME